MVNRKPNRIKDYDYSQAGFYFVTVCTHDRKQLFGNIADGKMILNASGEMARKVWDEIPLYYQGIQIDEFVIMPNHLHGIIIIGSDVGTGPRACPIKGQTQGSVPTGRLSLSDVVSRYKSLTTIKYIDGVKRGNWPKFDKQFWQRSFYDHVIRNDQALRGIREYIINNPLRWDLDEENPDNVGDKKISEK